MAASPAVSVVIPARNGERHLAETIDSVLAQTFTGLELLVVDDGSTDGTREIVQGYGRALRCIPQSAAGPGAARNRGIRDARGEYLAFLDHDDLWSPDKLEVQLEVFARSDAVDLVFGHMRHFLSPDIAPDLADRIVCPPEPRPAFLSGAMLVRRETMRRLGGFETARPTNEFLVPALRIAELGLRRVTVPETVLLRRLHESNYHVVNPAARRDYAFALKTSLDRRRAETRA